jgi:regulator of RNase E activity RraA
VECAGVAVASGDLVFGDVDGVVVIPQAREHEVIERALAKDPEQRFGSAAEMADALRALVGAFAGNRSRSRTR